MPKLSPKLLAAGAVALVADFLQVVLFPFFFEGAASPFNDALDLAVAAILTSLLGWHWVFLPSFAGEMIPGLDMAPFWTGAVFYVAMKSKPKEVDSPSSKTHAHEILVQNPK